LEQLDAAGDVEVVGEADVAVAELGGAPDEPGGARRARAEAEVRVGDEQRCEAPARGRQVPAADALGPVLLAGGGSVLAGGRSDVVMVPARRVVPLRRSRAALRGSTGALCAEDRLS